MILWKFNIEVEPFTIPGSIKRSLHFSKRWSYKSWTEVLLNSKFILQVSWCKKKLKYWSQLRSSKEVEYQMKWNKNSSPMPEVKNSHLQCSSPISEVQITSLSARSAPPPVEECIHHVLTTGRSCSMMTLEVASVDTWKMVHRSVSVCGELVQVHSVQVDLKSPAPLHKLVKCSTPKQRIQSLLEPSRSSQNRYGSRSWFLTQA